MKAYPVQLTKPEMWLLITALQNMTNEGVYYGSMLTFRKRFMAVKEKLEAGVDAR